MSVRVFVESFRKDEEDNVFYLARGTSRGTGHSPWDEEEEEEVVVCSTGSFCNPTAERDTTYFVAQEIRSEIHRKMSSNAESAEQLEMEPDEEVSYDWQGLREYIMEVIMPICSCGVATGIAVGAVLTSLFLNFVMSPKTIKELIGLKPTTTTPRTYFAYPPPANVCFTGSCSMMSNLLQSMLSEHVEPCDDFYEYVCGRYATPEGRMHKTLEMDVKQAAREWAEAIVVPKTGQTAEQKSVALLRACKATRTNNVKNPADLLGFMAHQQMSFSGSDTTHDGLDRLFGLSLHYGLHVLFQALVPSTGDLTPSGQRVLRLHWNAEYESWINRGPKVDVHYYNKRLSAFGVDTSMQQAIKGSETTVGNAMRSVAAESEQEVPKAIKDIDPGARGEGPWLPIIRKYASPQYTAEDQVWTTEKLRSFLKTVLAGLRNDEINLLANWELIRQFGPYVSNELSDDYDDSTYYTRCDKMLDEVASMSFYHIHGIVNPVALRSVGSLASNVQNGLLAWISTSTLVDKQASLDDVAQVNFVLGFPEGLQTKRDLEMSWSVVPDIGENFLGAWLRKRKSWITWKLNHPGIFLFPLFGKELPFNKKSHVVGVPATVLHNFLFREDMLAAVNYASLGHLIATALIEGFVTFKPSNTPCKQRSRLLGLHIAHKAYLQNSAEQAIRLPVLRLSSGKLFFVSACLKTCASRGVDGAEESADCHDLVENMQSFAETFECVPNSNMNPSKKCDLSRRLG
ncbi:uncharacterized protein LOC135385064 [Ornithodoros turicata]|uniref:uncharacterized protein LOC135385064 n=1 Tax=Ornithodoros turicata TaxID=34597 RepID=UPI003139EBA4